MTQSNETVFVSMRRYRSKVLIPYDVGCLHGLVFGKLLMLSYQYYESMRNFVLQLQGRSEGPYEETQGRARSGARMAQIILTQMELYPRV